MKITKEQAVSLFESLGYQTASKWSIEKMDRKLSKIAELTQEGTVGPTTEEAKVFLTSVLESKEPVTVETSGQPEEATTEPKQPKEKKEKKEKKEAAKDQYGNRVGSQSAVINAALEKTNTIAGLVTKTGLKTARVSGHLKFLVSQNILEVSGKDYILKS